MYPFTYINNITCITQYNGTEENNFILTKYEIPCLNILYIQIKIYLLSILHISLQIQYNFNLKIREDCNHYRHTSSVYETYRQIGYPCVELSNKPICVLACGCVIIHGTHLQTKRHVRRKR